MRWWLPVDTVSAHSCTLHNPAIFTFNLVVVCCSLTNVMSLSLSLFFPLTYFPFHFPLASSHLCHHFMKMEHGMISLMHIAPAGLVMSSRISSLLAPCPIYVHVGLCFFPTHSVSLLFLFSVLLSLLFHRNLCLRLCVSSCNPLPSVNLHVSSLILLIILTLLHSPFP